MRKVPTGTRPASHRRRNASSRGTIRPRSALPINKGRRVRCSNQPLYRRRRMALLVLVLLLVVVLAMGNLGVGGMGDERPGQVDAPTFEEAVEEVDEPAGYEEEAPEEKFPEEEA